MVAHVKLLKIVFFLQVIILCFESYFLVEMGLSGGWMTICAFGILLQTMVIVILVF
jgi:hypothetical protein